MARFQTLISLDRIHCYKQPEISGSEPYLWTAFFKLDGDTIVVDLDAGGFFLSGPCTFVGTGGSHGNLGDTDVRTGDDVPIPPALGQCEFSVRTFRASERLGSGETNARGAVGVVVALIEHESITDDGAEAGRAAFNREVEKGINEIIPTLREEGNFEPTAEDIAALKEKVFAAVKAAVINAQGFWRSLGILLVPLLERDKQIGADVFYGGETEAIDKRLQRIVPVTQPFPHPPLQRVTHDYGVFGEIRWTIESLQVAGVTADGGMWHTVRHEDRWDGFGDVKGVAGSHPGTFEAVGCAGVNGELHVCGVSSGGDMSHSLRRQDGGWYGWGDFKGVVAGHPGKFAAVGCAGVNGELHVCGVTRDGDMWHTIRRQDGSWYGWGAFRGVVAGHPGPFAAVGCAGVNGELHVCGVTTGGNAWHTTRRQDGGWHGWGDFNGVVAGNRGKFVAVSCAGVNGELHVCGIAGDGDMWHTIRREDGGWYGWGAFKGVVEGNPGAFESVGCAGVNEELHVCGVTSDGGMWHAIRREHDWIGFGDVKGQAGGHPGTFAAAALAGVG